jgi:hypothetical protein
MRGLKHQGVLSDIANALPTPFQRAANALPMGCVFHPPYPPKGVGTARPLEGGPTPSVGRRLQAHSMHAQARLWRASASGEGPEDSLGRLARRRRELSLRDAKDR